MALSAVTKSVSKFTYNTFFKRESVYFSTVVVGAVAFSIYFNSAVDNWWDNRNKGKQWKDIKDKYVKPAEE
ncbi:qcr9 subunit 9 of the ubiquinol cytochrome-c reductase complex [Mycoemilia scoparia]|uniref:Complex III subunit 9 n=1 Tax=Mycoemilia scoparia TaxID=417184 RepID=A0A9W8DUV5_9FUNG|nr:qcr9 subunit 9 of the ubiquinol cytochrome-c reductase complex [Mycoemilia scoparia]